MPRGRPKLIGPLLPKGGSRTLNTKKRLGLKNLAYQMMDFNLLSGSNADLRTAPYGIPKVLMFQKNLKNKKNQKDKQHLHN